MKAKLLTFSFIFFTIPLFAFDLIQAVKNLESPDPALRREAALDIINNVRDYEIPEVVVREAIAVAGEMQLKEAYAGLKNILLEKKSVVEYSGFTRALAGTSLGYIAEIDEGAQNGDKITKPLGEALLTDVSPVVRAASCRALGKTYNRKFAEPYLVQGLNDPEPVVQLECSRGLIRLGAVEPHPRDKEKKQSLIQSSNLKPQQTISQDEIERIMAEASAKLQERINEMYEGFINYYKCGELTCKSE